MRRLTLTLNPAFDLHYRSEQTELFDIKRSKLISRDAGGKGINLSRALAAHGEESLAVTLVPEDDGGFVKALSDEGLNVLGIRGLTGAIRENITVHKADGTEARPSAPFARRGAVADSNAVGRVEEVLTAYLGAGDILCVCGSLPPGIDSGSLGDLLVRMAFARVRLVLDTNGLDPADIPRLRPFLMKPNREELGRYVGEVRDLDGAVEGACRLHGLGVGYAMVTLDADGALLACDEGVFRAVVPKIRALSTVGAGDSSIAGFIAAYCKGMRGGECLRYAVASGSAACLTEGTAAPRMEDILALLPMVRIEKIK